MARTVTVASDPILGGIVEALSGKHGQVDIRLDHVAISVPGSRLKLELTGSVSVVVHMRDLSDSEERAHIERNTLEIRGH